jgi:hypothetical protein
MEIYAFTKYRRCGDCRIPMNYFNECGEDVKGQRTTYLIKFYSSNDEVPLFSKIGTTAKSVNERLRDEIGDYRKSGYDITRADVCKIWNCGNTPPEAFESFLRALLIADYPGTWKRNDRFFDTDIPVERFCEICDRFSKVMV